MRWLQGAGRTGFLCRRWYEQDPLLTPVRRLPAFKALHDDIGRTSDRIAAKYAADVPAPDSR